MSEGRVPAPTGEPTEQLSVAGRGVIEVFYL